jgi:uncharacterized protein (DUF4415 family)
MAAKSFALFRPVAPTDRRNNVMNKPTTFYELELNNPPPLTAEQVAELEALKAMAEEAIDYSDIPPLGDAPWRNPLVKPTQTATTVRVDSDVLLWLQSTGKNYQTRINSILREAMLNDRGKPASP